MTQRQVNVDGTPPLNPSDEVGWMTIANVFTEHIVGT